MGRRRAGKRPTRPRRTLTVAGWWMSLMTAATWLVVAWQFGHDYLYPPSHLPVYVYPTLGAAALLNTSLLLRLMWTGGLHRE